MQCKYHTDRRAEHFCSACGIPLCRDCAEESDPGVFYCFQCAMLQSVSDAGTTIKDQRETARERKLKKKKKWGPFQYFVVASSVLILVMWTVILFGGQEAPEGRADFANQPRLLLFMVDSSLKRFAFYEGNRYPDKLADLIPRYLAFGENELPLLDTLKYRKDSQAGYFLSMAKPIPGQMNMTISPKGITFEPPAGGGA